MKHFFLLVTLWTATVFCAFGGGRSMDFVARKNFPLSYALSSGDAVRICASDKALRNIAEAKRQALQNAGEGADAASCLLWTEAEIEVAASRLAVLYSSRNALGSIVASLREQGPYVIYDALSDKEFLAKAFRQDAEGMNNALGVYALGKKGQYAKIDSLSFDVRSRAFRNTQADIHSNVLKETENSGLFFDVPLNAAMKYMEASDRNEAADLEPLAEGENAAAIAAVAGTIWKNYPYTVILVPGSGPEVEGQPLSPIGRLRTEYAAMLYKEKKAPFILVSGGRVHPRQTKYIEALEMKRYLVEQCGIPASAILIDPHARHTTTNFRNAARIMCKAGFPMEKKALVSSSKFQLDYILSEKFRNLCIKMMQVIPFTLGERVNERELEFIPSTLSLQCSPIDPLDP